MIKTDAQLSQEVEQELASEPKLNASGIAINVDQGAVSLLGTIDTYAEKAISENAAKRVNGVRAIALDLEVRLPESHLRTDSDIAVAVQNALSWDVLIPTTVKGKVEDGWITLEGPVTWNYQREAAELAVRNLVGVVGVFNAITIKPEVSAAEVKEKIEAALERRTRASVQAIRVEVVGGKVTLTGHAGSWRAVEDAANAAWAAPGVTEVVDQVKMSMASF
jgi:osmotically-inducible protein OsmY